MDSIKKRNMNTDENNLFIFDCPAVPVSGILQESEVGKDHWGVILISEQSRDDLHVKWTLEDLKVNSSLDLFANFMN